MCQVDIRSKMLRLKVQGKATHLKETRPSPSKERARLVWRYLECNQDKLGSIVFHGAFWGFIFLVISPIVGVLLLGFLVHRVFKYFDETLINPSDSKIDTHGCLNRHELAVFITGCDRGFGQGYAYSLAERGYIVFAGCYTEEGMKQYNDYPSITALKVDVTKDEDPILMASVVSKWLQDPSAEYPRYLHAIINNAAVGSNGPIDWTPVSDFQNVMEVNYFGVIRMVKAFLPIFKSQSYTGAYKDARIINMGSFAGHIALPGSPPYVISKFAAQNFSTCLRTEMKAFDIPVVTLNPSVHGTTMLEATIPAFERKWANLSPELKKEYGQESYQLWSDMLKDCISITWDAKSVITEMIKCVEAIKPGPEVIVGIDAKFVLMFLKLLPTWATVKIFTFISPITKRAKQETAASS